MLSGFEKTIDLLKRGLDVSVLRRNVIANNIANAETPNFKRSVLNFESTLKRALDSEKARVPRQFVTDGRHIPFHQPVDYRTVRPRLVATPSPAVNRPRRFALTDRPPSVSRGISTCSAVPQSS